MLLRNDTEEILNLSTWKAVSPLSSRLQVCGSKKETATAFSVTLSSIEISTTSFRQLTTSVTTEDCGPAEDAGLELDEGLTEGTEQEVHA